MSGILSLADYGVLVLMLAVSAGTGIYFGFRGPKLRTETDYLFAGKSMSIFPVAVSMLATFMSATALVGYPAELYVYGTSMMFVNVGFFLGSVVGCLVFLPIYFDQDVTTPYEGGMKAVLWTDVFQASLMYTCLLVIIVNGCIDLGGMSNVLKRANEGGRLMVPTFQLDFSARYTMYSVLLTGIIISTEAFGCSQNFIQRNLSLKTLKSSIVASLISAPMLLLFGFLATVCGIVLYATFKDCDPMASPQHGIHSTDQLMPYYIVKYLNQYPGLPGLCIAGIFSASLSSLSSALSSMAAMTYEDFIKQVWPDPSKAVMIAKVASAFYGAISICVTFLGSSIGNLIQANVMIVGTISGPSLGMFLLAVTSTTANEKGANIGLLSGFIVAGCLTFIPKPAKYPVLPVGQNCSHTDAFNQSDIHLWTGTTFNHSGVQKTFENDAQGSFMQKHHPENFSLSYMWIGPIGLLITLVIGFFSSVVISCFRGQSEEVASNLLCPLRRRFSPKDANAERETSYPKDECSKM